MSETRNCEQCNDDFVVQDKELFCSDECRYKFWRSRDPKRKNKYSLDLHLHDLHLEIDKFRAEGKKILIGYTRLENDYSDWEDRLVAIENRVHELEVEVGIEEKEIMNNLTSKPKYDIDFDALDVFED